MVFESDADRALGLAPDARTDIRRAEAARMLGFLSADGLPDRAAGWLAGGVNTSNVRALAGSASGADVSDGVRLALVGEIAAELDLGFSNLMDARSMHAEQIIRSMSSGEQVGTQIFDLSNGITDEFTTKVRAFFSRFLNRG